MDVHRHKLVGGMIVATPPYILDEDGNREPIAKVWGGAVPSQLVVELWDWEEGESHLRADDGTYIDANVLDYPLVFKLLGTVDLTDRFKDIAYRFQKAAAGASTPSVSGEYFELHGARGEYVVESDDEGGWNVILTKPRGGFQSHNSAEDLPAVLALIRHAEAYGDTHWQDATTGP